VDEPEMCWSPPLWRVCVYAAGGLAALAVAGFEPLARMVGSLDAPGRLLVAVVGVALLGYAARDALARPALRVGPEGIDLVDGMRRRHLPWAAVRRIRAGTLTHGRRLVHIRTLEIDTIDETVLLSRRQLGTAPERVAHVLEEFRLRKG
jgi:hypothetical protein